MAKGRKANEIDEAAGEGNGPAEVLPAEMVTARFRLAHLGGEPGAEMRPVKLHVAAKITEDGVEWQKAIMAGEIDILLTSPEAVRMFETGDGLFEVTIRPAGAGA